MFMGLYSKAGTSAAKIKKEQYQEQEHDHFIVFGIAGNRQEHDQTKRRRQDQRTDKAGDGDKKKLLAIKQRVF